MKLTCLTDTHVILNTSWSYTMRLLKITCEIQPNTTTYACPVYLNKRRTLCRYLQNLKNEKRQEKKVCSYLVKSLHHLHQHPLLPRRHFDWVTWPLCASSWLIRRRHRVEENRHCKLRLSECDVSRFIWRHHQTSITLWL